jgi:hypothetical protein
MTSSWKACFVLAFGALASGCSVDGIAPSAFTAESPTVWASLPDASDAGASPDGSISLASPNGASGASPDVQQAPSARTYWGNPLCNASHASQCYPDELPEDPTTAQACQEAPDGGPFYPEAGYGDAGLACHVTGAAGAAQPACAPAGRGVDGDSCSQSSDCAAGFERIEGGVCRHYCCSGNQMCPQDHFCDIEPVVGRTGLSVPVCVQIQPCTLLEPRTDTTRCTPVETCGIARPENGTTSCVEFGTAKVGEACDVEHCATGLVCLNSRCYVLCLRATPIQCTASQWCKGGLPLFPDVRVGVCEDMPDAGHD